MHQERTEFWGRGLICQKGTNFSWLGYFLLETSASMYAWHLFLFVTCFFWLTKRAWNFLGSGRPLTLFWMHTSRIFFLESPFLSLVSQNQFCLSLLPVLPSALMNRFLMKTTKKRLMRLDFLTMHFNLVLITSGSEGDSCPGTDVNLARNFWRKKLTPVIRRNNKIQITTTVSQPCVYSSFRKIKKEIHLVILLLARKHENVLW